MVQCDLMRTTSENTSLKGLDSSICPHPQIHHENNLFNKTVFAEGGLRD